MRRSTFIVGIFFCLLSVVTANWSKEDQEIFRLRDEVEASEGTGVTFYNFLDCSPKVSQDELNKAYKKRARVLHPDKATQQFIANQATGKDKPKEKSKKPGVHVSKGPSKKEIAAAKKAASDRFARLGIVTNILRGEGRARYDHFLYHGFPKWKGTGYYYARYRPGLGTVLTLLFIAVGGGGHWYALYLTWGRDQKFMQKYIDFARSKALGDSFNIPGLNSGKATPPVVAEEDPNQPTNRRQRRMMEKDSKKDKFEKKTKGIKASKSPIGTPPVGATGPKKRLVAENGKILVVDQAGNVYMEQSDEDGNTHEFLLDPKVVPRPGLTDTALVRLPRWAVRTAYNRIFNRGAEADIEEFLEEEDRPSSSSGADDFEVLEKVKTTAPNGNDKVVKRKKSARR
ncbi:hypothetical protein BJ878DRAFT_532002 [Calycina marina]|uniref:J domain-containing protein n=1 Tax=Calycina marina TaxID=1763456 RepID=A0A9P8CIV0_9HELO|nr:hypothetical protein BJ878DRAFT_532002 [Calycina marina]